MAIEKRQLASTKRGQSALLSADTISLSFFLSPTLYLSRFVSGSQIAGNKSMTLTQGHRQQAIRTGHRTMTRTWAKMFVLHLTKMPKWPKQKQTNKQN